MIITYGGNDVKLDSFFKVLLFQHLMDTISDQNMRNLTLVIYRNTICYNKLSDTLANFRLQKETGFCRSKLYGAIRQCEEMDYIAVNHSQGGLKGKERFSRYKLSDKLLSDVIEAYLAHKEDNHFFV